MPGDVDQVLGPLPDQGRPGFDQALVRSSPADLAGDGLRLVDVAEVAQTEQHLHQPDTVGQRVVVALERHRRRLAVGACQARNEFDVPQRVVEVELLGEAFAHVGPQVAHLALTRDDGALDMPVDVEVGVELPIPLAVLFDRALSEDVVPVHHAFLMHGDVVIEVGDVVQPEHGMDVHQVVLAVHVEPGLVGGSNRHQLAVGHST